MYVMLFPLGWRPFATHTWESWHLLYLLKWSRPHCWPIFIHYSRIRFSHPFRVQHGRSKRQRPGLWTFSKSRCWCPVDLWGAWKNIVFEEVNWKTLVVFPPCWSLSVLSAIDFGCVGHNFRYSSFNSRLLQTEKNLDGLAFVICGHPGCN